MNAVRYRVNAASRPRHTVPQQYHPTDGDPVPSLMKKLTEFARSPQSSSAVAKVKEQAAKPENKARIAQLKTKMGRKP